MNKKRSVGKHAIADNEAVAICRMIRVSPRKLGMVADAIRGKSVQRALADLSFSRKRIALVVRETVRSAVANAENNHGLNVDSLVVSEIWVGKSRVLHRGRPRARGRYGKIEKFYSQLTVKLGEQEIV
jgi:large subunit ribosomal protein L22